MLLLHVSSPYFSISFVKISFPCCESHRWLNLFCVRQVAGGSGSGLDQCDGFGDGLRDTVEALGYVRCGFTLLSGRAIGECCCEGEESFVLHVVQIGMIS